MPLAVAVTLMGKLNSHANGFFARSEVFSEALKSLTLFDLVEVAQSNSHWRRSVHSFLELKLQYFSSYFQYTVTYQVGDVVDVTDNEARHWQATRLLNESEGPARGHKLIAELSKVKS